MRRAAPAFRANFLALFLALKLFAAPAGAQEPSPLGLPPVPAAVAGAPAARRLGE